MPIRTQGRADHLLHTYSDSDKGIQILCSVSFLKYLKGRVALASECSIMPCLLLLRKAVVRDYQIMVPIAVNPAISIV